ncbi:MAG: NUDIX domain-containing protein [Rhizomicrobium sp.]|jgi:8-oxo-dGTP pyrophosphatase MutT (NUDIX family)
MPSLLRKTFFRLRILLQAILSPVAFGALALVEQGGKVVLIRHSYTAGWHLPGGGVQNGEPPEKAVMRELKEELGLTGASEPEFVGIFTRKIWPVTNVIALYRVREARFDFKPSLEVREIVLADPASPPLGTLSGVRRRLAELAGLAPQSPYW